MAKTKKITPINSKAKAVLKTIDDVDTDNDTSDVLVSDGEEPVKNATYEEVINNLDDDVEDVWNDDEDGEEDGGEDEGAVDGASEVDGEGVGSKV